MGSPCCPLRPHSSIIPANSGWRLHANSTSKQPIFERPLGVTELGFYWDSVFERTADTLQNTELQIHSGSAKEIFGLANITRTWSNLKQLYPLLAAQIEERDQHQIFFVVADECWRRARHGEVFFQDIASRQDASELADRFIVRDRLLTNNLLARIFVLRRTDQDDILHVIFHVSHCVTDGVANSTILRTFLDLLSSPSSSQPRDLMQRLMLSRASEDLSPQHHLPVARRRWRLATAAIIAANRASRLSGGHSLPRKISQLTPYTPAYSRHLQCSFSKEKSQTIVLNCRKNGLTFGNAYPVLAQVALTRVLCRRYLRGDISEEEWQFRKREPMLTAGPINLRPYLNKNWLEQGGLTNVSLVINFYRYSLSFMSLGSSSHLCPGMDLPSYESLLSRSRFLYRSRMVKKRAAQFMNHPIFMELTIIEGPGWVERAKQLGLHWRKEKRPPQHFNGDLLSPMEQARQSLVFCNGGSTLGNIDHLIPRQYPLRKASATSLHLNSSVTTIRCRPAELYLGAATYRKQLHMSVFWDNNVFDKDVVTEWLNEVQCATEFYLGHDGYPSTHL